MECGNCWVLICGHECAHISQLHMAFSTPTTHSNSHSDLWSRAGFARHGQKGCGDAGERPELGERQATGQWAWGQVWEKRKEGIMCLVRAGSPDCFAIVPPKTAVPSPSLNGITAPQGDITAERDMPVWSREASIWAGLPDLKPQVLAGGPA